MRWFRRRPREQSPYVTVLETGQKSAIALARSVLDSAGIRYEVSTDLVEDFFGWGRLGSRFNFVTGPAKLRVNREDEEVARGLIGDMEIGRPWLPWGLRLAAAVILFLTACSIVLGILGYLR